MNKIYNKALDDKIRLSTKYLGIQLFSFFINFLGWDTVSFAFPFWGIYILLRLVEKKGRLFPTSQKMNEYWGWIGWSIMIIIAGIICLSRPRAFLLTAEYLFAIIFFFCIIDADLSIDELKWLFKIYTYMAIAVTILIVLQHTYFGSTMRFTVNIFGVKKDPNYLAAYLLCPAIYNFYGVYKKNKGAILFFFIIALGIFLTGSRGAFVSLALAIILFILFNNNLKMLLSIFIITAFLALVLIFIVPESISSRFILTQSLDDGSNSLRLRLWKAGFMIFLDNFFVGAGPSAMITYGMSYGAPVANTIVHNTYIEMLCEYGIIGFILFIVPIIKVALKSLCQKQIITISIMAGFLCASFIISAQTLQYFWFDMALCASVAAHKDFLSSSN